jgi:formamidopyrimidine-DNA glycosylase
VRDLRAARSPTVHAGTVPVLSACPSCPRWRSSPAAWRGAAGRAIESRLAPGINALKTFDPPLTRSRARRSPACAGAASCCCSTLGDLTLLIHLMTRAAADASRSAARCATARRGCCCACPSERELRLREFGTKQAAWVKLPAPDGLEATSAATLGPEAWPDPPGLGELLDSRARCTRCCATSR